MTLCGERHLWIPVAITVTQSKDRWRYNWKCGRETDEQKEGESVAVIIAQTDKLQNRYFD